QAASNLGDLVDRGMMSAEMAGFLTTCIEARRNVVVCGTPDAGRVEILAALVAASPEGERVVSIEQAAELAVDRADWIALEARPGAVDVATLLHSALRMRPDRLVIGDVRGGEAFELLQAMGSSIDGALVAVSGDGARSALARLSTLAQLGAGGSGPEAVRDLVASVVSVVVHVARFADGVTRVIAIEEVLGAVPGGFDVQEIFGYRGGDAGGFQPTGAVPAFYAELDGRGVAADRSIFQP